MDETRRVTRSRTRGGGSNSGSNASLARPSFLVRLASAQSSQSSRPVYVENNNANGYDGSDPSMHSPLYRAGSRSQDSDEYTEAAAIQHEETSHAPTAARRLFHLSREASHASPSLQQAERYSRTPEIHDFGPDPESDEETSYLATHAMAMAHQRAGYGHTSPSATLALTAATNLNHQGRYTSSNRHQRPQQVDEDLEEYEGTNSDGDDPEAEEYEEGEVEEPEEEEEEEVMAEEEDLDSPLNPSEIGLKEISNLGKFTVNSYKQGNGVEELRNDDLKLFWQSDGPLPHKLTVYFIKRVSIRAIRFHVNFNEDESYTPTKIMFKSGTSENNLIEFASLELATPVGWQDVPIQGCGGGIDGNTLVSYVLQMAILENHQNGKDTHVRGIKIYAQEHEERAFGGNGLPAIDTETMDMAHSLDHKGSSFEQENLSGFAPSGGPTAKMGLEAARKHRLMQDAFLDEWTMDSNLKSPGSITSLTLR